MNLTIGSGDIRAYLSKKTTKGYAKLLQKFVADDKPYYNSFASPIHALRTGAILENRYLTVLDDSYFTQYKSTSKEFNCLTSSIDFAKIEKGVIVDFDELKTIYFTEYINIILPLLKLTEKEQIQYLKKKFKANYNQVQFQLYCSGLNKANLVFLSVESYDDDENHTRIVEEKDIVKFKIPRDETVIDLIRERAVLFQTIKDNII